MFNDLYEIEINCDNSIQLRLCTDFGFVDLVFVDDEQFIGTVAGQHQDDARKLLQQVRWQQRVLDETKQDIPRLGGNFVDSLKTMTSGGKANQDEGRNMNGSDHIPNNQLPRQLLLQSVEDITQELLSQRRYVLEQMVSQDLCPDDAGPLQIENIDKLIGMILSVYGEKTMPDFC